jgi:hyperosmotically inducible periplasmic protein
MNGEGKMSKPCSSSFKRPSQFLLSVMATAVIFLGIAGTSFARPAAQVSQGQMAANPTIVREVHHELAMLPFYSVFDDLAYRVDGTKVTLIGKVVRPVLKDDAGNAVKHIEGVTQVDNQIEVLPPSPMDDQIRRAEYRAIYSEPSLQMYAVRNIPPIHIIVDNGHVTLTGVVANSADKDLAGIRANQVPNVFSVDNQLQVENTKSGS